MYILSISVFMYSLYIPGSPHSGFRLLTCWVAQEAGANIEVAAGGVALNVRPLRCWQSAVTPLTLAMISRRPV